MVLAAAFVIAIAVPSPRFERDVKPILAAKCLKCHGGEQTKSGFDVRTAAAIRAGGDTGPAVVSGNLAKSQLFEMVSNGTMPPGKAARLTAAELDIVKR